MPGPGPSSIQLIGIAYGLLFTLIGAFLWRTGRFSRTVKYILLLVTILLGFAIFSPMLPFMFQELVISAGSFVGVALLSAALGMTIFFLFALLFGRQFCGHLCPIGALQELASLAPTPKIQLPWKVALMSIRGIVFCLIIFMGITFSIAILAFFGIRQFFTLTFSLGFIVFVVLIALSLFVYRPFCRIICPLGAFFQLCATFAWWKIRRTDACIECKKCEMVCPTNEAKKDDVKGECYLCRRCIEVCPTEGALYYGKKGEPDRKR